jgi:hypothetical protein
MDSDRKRTAPNEINIKHAEGGGYIVRHSYDNTNSGPSYMPSKEHAFSTHEEMVAHVSKHLKAGFKGKQNTDHLTVTGNKPASGRIANPQGVESTAGKPKGARDPQRNPKKVGKAWRTGQGLRQGQAAAPPRGVQSRAPNRKTYGAGVD